MSNFCDVCDKTLKLKSKNNLCKSNFHKELDKCKYMELSIENPSKSYVDEILYACSIEQKMKYDYYPIKCHFLLLFNDNQRSENVKSN